VILKEDYKAIPLASSEEKIDSSFSGPIPSMDDLLRSKKASGRTKVLVDAEPLDSLRNFEPIPL